MKLFANGSILALLCASPILDGQVSVEVGPKDPQVNWRDKANDMVLKGFTDFRVQTTPNGMLTFSGTGDVAHKRPCVAAWEASGMRITAMQMDGTAKRAASNAFILNKASIKGAVNFRLENKFDQQNPQIIALPQVGTFTTESMLFSTDGSKLFLNIPTKVKVTYDSDGVMGSPIASPTGQKPGLSIKSHINLVFTSSSAHFSGSADEQASLPLNGAFEGSVHWKVTRTVATTPPQVTTITGVADRVTGSQTPEGGRLAMTGHVQIDGDDPSWSGTSSASSITMTLDASGAPIGFELKGQVQSTFATRSKSGGKGARR